jgi:hypothetical protein
MMTTRRTDSLKLMGPALLALLILALPATLLADEPDPTDNTSTVIIIGDDGEEIFIEMEAVHEIVAEAMGGLDEVMAELEDMQFQVRLGQDNRLDLSYDDTTFELDLDQIMSQVAVAVQAGFENIHTEDWTNSHNRWEATSEDDLRRELNNLQKEMKELRRELRKIRDSDED